MHLGVSRNRGFYPPNHPFVHSVFHEINHPFWGTLFLETPIFWGGGKQGGSFVMFGFEFLRLWKCRVSGHVLGGGGTQLKHISK